MTTLKTMKKTLFLSAAVAATMTLGSCNDFLTEDNRGVENLDTYFSNQEQLDSYVTGCYSCISYMGWWQIYNPWLMFDMVTDDMWMGNTTQTPDYTSLVFFQPDGASNGPLSNFWQYRYKGIANINTGLENVDKAAVKPELREQRKAEMRFLRAFFYFDLVKNFGGVPLLTSFLDPSQLAGVERASADEVYEFIEKELSEVAEILPQRSAQSSAEVGHATRGAALGFLGKAQLYQGKYAEAKATLKKIIDSGEYHLMEDFGQVWNVKYNNNAESLFEIQSMYNGDLYPTGTSLTVVTGCRNGIGDGWSWGQPTSDLENAYIAAGDTERLRWTIIKTACTEIAGETQFDKFIENNWTSTVFSGNDIESALSDEKFKGYCKEFGWTPETLTSTYIVDPAQHKSARILRKYFVPLAERPDIYNIDKIPLNHRLLRYADVLLMYAEACNATGDDGEARTALNEVRHRVNLDNVTSSGTQLRDAIRLERRLELATENQRLYDIRRWDADNGKKVIENLFGPNGSFVKYNLGPDADMYEKYNQRESSDKGIRFEAPRDLLFPIPLYEIQNSNGSIKQNPGW